jgi:hypothetical protein
MLSEAQECIRMQKIGKNKKLVLTLAIVALMFGSVFLASAYAAAPPFTATISETGLPTGATYAVNLINATHTATGSASAGSPVSITGLYNGTYELSATATPGAGHTYSALVWDAPSSNLVGISGPYTGSVTFSVEYLLNFTEKGLPAGTSWVVQVGNTQYTSTKSYQSFNELNGTYTYEIYALSGYSPSPGSGSVVVSGANQTVAITYTQTSTAKLYPVNFVESYLPSGTTWQVNLGGGISPVSSNTNTITFNLANGSYTFTIPDVGHWYAVPFSGTFTVNGNTGLPTWEHSGLQLNITFRYGYLVTFTAANLAKYVPWSVTFNGTLNSTTGSGTTVTFEIRNGTNYSYSISIAQNWVASPLSGKLNVSGAAVSQTITFTEQFYKVIFVETGLPPGTAWVLTVNNVPYPTTNGTVILSEHNGTFTYVAPSEQGYTVSPATGTVTLGYADSVTHITYSATTIRTGTGNSTGGFITTTGITKFFESTMGEITIAAIVILALVGVMIYELGGKKGKKSKKNYK